MLRIDCGRAYTPCTERVSEMRRFVETGGLKQLKSRAHLHYCSVFK